MNMTKLAAQFAVILTIGIALLYFSREMQIEELAAIAAEEYLFSYNPDSLPQYFEEDELEDEPIVKRVELNLDEADEVVAESEIETEKRPKFFKNQGLTTISEEDLKPYMNAKHLDLSGNQLTDLPRVLMKMPYLEGLILDNNNFETIPYFLRHCKRLKAIYINNNPLTSIGLNVFKMKQLKALQLENTDLKNLPTFPDKQGFIVVLSERNYSNKSKEKLRDYLARKYKYTLFELY